MKLRGPALFLLLVGLSACASDQAMTAAATGELSALVATSSQQPAPAHDAQAALQDFANAAPLPSGAAFQWFYWEGEVPADVDGETWGLEEFRYARDLDGPEWNAFADALRSTFPGGVLVYELAEPCENCTKTLYIIQGKASWGTGGFLGHTFRDH